MFDAVVTLVYTKIDEKSDAIYPVTEVYRLEFDTHADMQNWLQTGRDGVHITDDPSVLSHEKLEAPSDSFPQASDL